MVVFGVGSSGSALLVDTMTGTSTTIALRSAVFQNIWAVSEGGMFVALVRKDDGSSHFEYRGLENQTLVATVPIVGNLCSNDQPICYASDLMYLDE
jgi:hypothetical protein